MTRAAMMRHGLRRNRFSAIGGRLGIAGRLLDLACCCLCGRRRLLSLLAGAFGARRSLVGTIRGIHRALRRIGLVRAPGDQRKGQYSPGKSNQF
ncbi:MAG TPA: hypothetical protein VMT58_02050 [Candidatus Binataceae bacterium]|nr:hypothetical protein [Candidatus Binataceae bacterium]